MPHYNIDDPFGSLFKDVFYDDDVNKIAKIAFQKELDKLKKDLKALVKFIQEASVEEQEKKKDEGIKFPDSFTFSNNGKTARISNENIQQLVEDLKKQNVPKGSFIAYRVGDTIALKIHDDMGISYIVSNNFWYADEN